MKKLKKQGISFICSLMAALMCISMVPKYADAAEEINVPKYHQHNDKYLRGMVKYKDKAFIEDAENKFIMNSDGTVRDTNLNVLKIASEYEDEWYFKKFGKSFVDPVNDSTYEYKNNIQYDIEVESYIEINQDVALKQKLENQLKNKYNVNMNHKIDLYSTPNYGENGLITWIRFEITDEGRETANSGFINVNTLEIIDKIGEYGFQIRYVNDEKMIFTEVEGNSGKIVVYENGNAKTSNFDGWYLSDFNDGKAFATIYITEGSGDFILRIYEFDGNQYNKVSEKKQSRYITYDVDVNGQLWIAEDINGKSYISKYEGRNFIPKYEVSNNIANLSVYDDNRIAVNGFDCGCTTNKNSAWYTIIDHKPGSSITLNKTELTLGKGETETLVATVNPSDAVNKNVKWTSSNTNVAKVDSNGKVTAVGIGNATITATTVEGGLTASAKVMVDFPTSDFKTHWGVDYIRNAMGNGWVIASEKFRPNDAITRAEFIKIVNKAFGYSEIGEEKYIDVYPNDWFYDEIRIAAKAGYISTANPKFRPNDPISREEVAVIVTTINNNKDSNLDKIKKYDDYKSISGWAQTSVEGAIEAGYMGVGVTNFYPLSEITRAEAVTTLIRVVEK